ncbi:MAG: ABATE domain-containing protein [Vicinamibacteraceae bacterium]
MASPRRAALSSAPQPTTAGEFSFVGNLLCVDFVNTEVMRQDERVDRLPGIDDVLRWAGEADLVDAAGLRGLPAGWRTSREAARVLQDATALRAVLRGAVEALADGRPLPGDVVPALNHALVAGASTLRLERRGDAHATVRVALDPSPAALLAPIAESAAWLLEHGDRALMRRCENGACIRFFYDTTKNRRRRWCAMDGCGSRAKAAAYYRRRKASEA